VRLVPICCGHLVIRLRQVIIAVARFPAPTRLAVAVGMGGAGYLFGLAVQPFNASCKLCTE
jgi:hypothetical protein